MVKRSFSLPNTNIQLFTLIRAVLMQYKNCQEHPRMIEQIQDWGAKLNSTPPKKEKKITCT